MAARCRHRTTFALLLVAAGTVGHVKCACATGAGDSNDTGTASETSQSLPGVTVTGQRDTADREQPAGTTASVDALQMQTTVNAVDVEDAAKYLPSIFIRKRNYGDTQPVIETRNWGVNASARTLVYVDDIPISALIANNNTIGAPRWGMVSPEEIDHLDLLYGPYASEYAGNSMGGVMHIVTRQPQTTQATFEQTGALQTFDLYGTDHHYGTSQSSATIGGRSGGLTWFVAGNFQNSFSQPLSLVTAGAPPAGSAGSVLAANKLGQPADVVGAGGLLHTREANLLVRLGYDLSPVWRLNWLIDYWRNDADSAVASYLTDGAGVPSYGRVAAFASNRYTLLENHLMNGLSLKSDSHSSWDAEAVATYYDFLQDRQLSPAGIAPAGTATSDAFSNNGRLADYGGTQWGTVDLKGIWRPLGADGPQEVSLGAHVDRYVLDNPTLNTTDWPDRHSQAGLYSSGRGRTETNAVWLQDVWNLSTAWRTTVGGRVEHWRASDGFNFSGSTGVTQPTESANAFSPKGVVSWRSGDAWTLTGSIARSVRFPTVGELYQLVSTGSTFSSPNPDLEPERDLSGELSVERAIVAGSVRLSVFQENTRDALTSQTSTLPGYPVPVTFVVNVGEVRNRGVELALQKTDVLLRGLDLEGSATFVDSRTLSDPQFVSSAGTTADGKHAPYVPRWRGTFVATYHAGERWALTLAGRYSGQMYSTLDNTDDTPHVFGAFDSFFVMDARLHCDVSPHLSASLGVDNLNNYQYFLYHPFPQRTFIADLRLKL
jgi:iron complex outermembrane receptor protein